MVDCILSSKHLARIHFWKYILRSSTSSFKFNFFHNLWIFYLLRSLSVQIIIFSISTFSVISMMVMIIIVKTFFQRCSHTPTKTSCTNNRLPQMVATTIITNIIIIIFLIISDVVIIIVCIDLVTPLLRSNRNSWLKTIIHCHQIHPLSVRLSHHH